MENRKPTSHILKGIIIAVVMMALNFTAQKVTQLPPVFMYLPTLVLVAGVIFSCIIYKKQSAPQPTFGDVFAHGFRTTAVVTLLMAVYMFIISKLAYPHTSEADIQVAMKSFEQMGNVMPAEARRMAEEGVKRAWIFDVSGTIFTTLVCGLVGSLIGGAIARAGLAKKKS